MTDALSTPREVILDPHTREPGRDIFPGDEEILEHPSSDLEIVMREILNAHPDTSFFFLDIGRLKSTVETLRDYFLPNNPHRVLAYAIKANSHKRVLDILEEGAIRTFDCGSKGEIQQVRARNKSAEILYNHPLKLRSHIAYAATQGVQHYTVQTLREVEKVLENSGNRLVTDPVELAVRMSTPNQAAAINLSDKYGATPSETIAIIQAIRDRAGCVPGISIHTGSQNTDLKSFVVAIKKMAEVAKEAGGVKTMNVGGGIPVNHYPEDDFDLRSYLEVISRAIEEYGLDGLMKDPKIIIELGRALVAEAVELAIPVIDVDMRDGQRCVYFNDGVFTSFIDAKLHGWKYPFSGFGGSGRQLSGQKVPCRLFGRTCDSGDYLGEVLLPEDLKDGDYIRVKSAGAYLDSVASRFNAFEPHKYVTYNPH